MQRFNDKVAVVTGGTSGIGEAVVRRLAAEGAAVVLAGRRPELGAAVAADVRDDGGRAHYVQVDVSIESEVDRLILATLNEYGRLDVAFNNAGSTSFAGPVAQLGAADWSREIEQNLTSVFFSLKHEIAAMDRGGSIVNNASVSAATGTPGMAAYTAAKHGVLGLTRAAALENAERDIRINALLTGNVDTALYRRLSGVDADDVLDPAPNPSRRAASPDEIAGFVAYLLSDEAAFVTGAALAMDGGFTAGTG